MTSAAVTGMKNSAPARSANGSTDDRRDPGDQGQRRKQAVALDGNPLGDRETSLRSVRLAAFARFDFVPWRGPYRRTWPFASGLNAAWWCPWSDSNGHSFQNSILSRARLPFRHRGPRAVRLARRGNRLNQLRGALPAITERFGDMNPPDRLRPPRGRRWCGRRAARGDNRARCRRIAAAASASSLRPGSSGVAIRSSKSPSASALVAHPEPLKRRDCSCAGPRHPRRDLGAAFGGRRQGEVGRADARRPRHEGRCGRAAAPTPAPDNRRRSAARGCTPARDRRDGRSGTGSSPRPAGPAPERSRGCWRGRR